jgi:hypothetical protein
VEAAKAEYHRADNAFQAFRREHIEELVAEARAEVDGPIATMRRGFELIAEGGGYDGRVEGWAALARAVLDGEIRKPGLSDAARDRLERLG